MQEQRRRLKQLKSFEERLAEDAKRLHEEADLLPPGAMRDAGSHMTEWLTSPGLRPPEHV